MTSTTQTGRVTERGNGRKNAIGLGISDYLSVLTAAAASAFDGFRISSSELRPAARRGHVESTS
jgi:hypothetical protein